MNIISVRICIVDTDVVSDVTDMHQSVITHGYTIFKTCCYPLNNSDVM